MAEEAVTIPSAGSAPVRHRARADGMRAGRDSAPRFWCCTASAATRTRRMCCSRPTCSPSSATSRCASTCAAAATARASAAGVICLEQVEDTRNALDLPRAAPRGRSGKRIGVIGSSFGGAVAVYAGGIDARVAAVISNGGWGDGERKFRGQHTSAEEWARFTEMLEEGASTARRPASR